ncbi:MAG: glycoside hydrolase family 13 protein [Faecousia sp.]
MRILFDSRKPQYKTPFGTIRTGQCCIMHIYIPKDCGATGVRLMLEDCNYAPTDRYEFVKESQTEDNDIYRCEFTRSECGLYYYWFYVTKADGGFRLFREGDGTNMEAGDKWQLSVIPEDFATPDYAKGAVMYQIMPDRFCKSGVCDLSEKLRPFTVHENWNDMPNYTPDAQGNWCSDFFGGNLNGVREKLPYLKRLGVGMIYFNPVFMAYSNHRYDTADYKRIDPMLGTEADFRALCEEAHLNNIRIILDGVFSHTGSNSVYFDAKHIFGNGAVSNPDSPYRSWYRFRSYPNDYESWWNMPTLPNVEELSQSYINYIIEDEDSVIAHWLRLGADGFRLDVVDELPDEFVLKLKRRLRELKPDALLIGEVWEDASNKRAYGVSRRYFVDAELDSVMNYPWRTGIIRYVLGEDDGSALGESIMSIAENYPPQVLACLMNHLGTHDTPRILTALSGEYGGESKAERAIKVLSPENRAKAKQRLFMAAFLQYMLPGMPSIFYGDEVGLEGYEDPFCRRTYPWGREDEELLDYYCALGRLKNENAALRLGDVRVTEAGNGRLAFVRRYEAQLAKIFINRSDRDWILPEGEIRFGRGIAMDGERRRLQPNGFCVIYSEPAQPVK